MSGYTTEENTIVETNKAGPSGGGIRSEYSHWHTTRVYFIPETLLSFPAYITSDVFESSLSNLEERLTKKIKKAEEHSVTTRKNLEGFTETYAKNRVKDIYSFADQIERADYQSNLSKASSVLITGNWN